MGAHDNLATFSDAQAITAAAYSTNFVDMEVVSPQVGVGGDVWLCIQTVVANTANPTDTVGIELLCSATNDATNVSGTIRCVMTMGNATTAIEVVQSDGRYTPAGSFVYRGTLPYECNLRYVQLYYNNTTSVGTQSFDAWLQAMPPKSDHGQVYVSGVGNP